MTNYPQIQTTLKTHRPYLFPDSDKKKAAVAVVIHPTADDFHLLFIERAAHPKDPWSGHIAFPGGTCEPEDSSLQQTAVRETQEELGLNLSKCQYMGQLDDVTGATLPVQVSAYVYATDDIPKLHPNEEIHEVFWVSFQQIIDPSRLQTLQLVGWQPLKEVPTIDLLGPGRPLLWGLTYRLVSQLASFAGKILPEMA
jgi:8-oxo-dGTP pyrophosphatase MutT (NUDIX family)